MDVAAPVQFIPEFLWVHGRLSNNDCYYVGAHAEPIPTLVTDLERLMFYTSPFLLMISLEMVECCLWLTPKSYVPLLYQLAQE